VTSTSVQDPRVPQASPLRSLWPGPGAVRTAWSPRGRGTDYLAIPSPSAPRLLVPVAVPGADRLLQRHGGGRRTRAGRAAWRLVHRARAARWAPLPRLRVQPGPDGVERFLADALGHPVRIGVLLGPPRANLKPVLPVFAPDGHVVAFAKVGTSAVTAPLLATEARALELLGGKQLRHVTTPRLLAYGRLERGEAPQLPVLVQQALPLATSGAGQVAGPAGTPLQAVAEIAAVCGLRREQLRQSDFWRSVAPVDESVWQGVDVGAFAQLHDAVPDGVDVVLGAWHGDLGPWNVAQGRDRLEVWDWERFETGVPAGLDAAHWRVQVDLMNATAAAPSWPTLRREVAASLGALAEQDAGAAAFLPDDVEQAAAVVAACYLLAIWARYRRDAPEVATPALRRRVRWLCELAAVVSQTWPASQTSTNPMEGNDR